MQQSGTPVAAVRYSVLGKLFHWSFIAIFAYGIYKQVDKISQLADGALLRFEVIFAAIFLILLGARFFYMSRMQSSALPENTHAAQKLGAKVVHYGMYVSMGLIAASGLIIGALYTHLWTRGSDDQCCTFHPRNICYGHLLVDRLAYRSRPLSSISARWSVERDGSHLARVINRQTEPYALCAPAGT